MLDSLENGIHFAFDDLAMDLVASTTIDDQPLILPARLLDSTATQLKVKVDEPFDPFGELEVGPAVPHMHPVDRAVAPVLMKALLYVHSPSDFVVSLTSSLLQHVYGSSQFLKTLQFLEYFTVERVWMSSLDRFYVPLLRDFGH